MSRVDGVVREKRYGDFLIRLQYVKPDAHALDAEHEPAMLITRVKGSGSRSVWIIMSNILHEYVGSGVGGEPSNYMFAQCMNIAKVLQLPENPSSYRKICDAILDNIEECLMMPPWDEKGTTVTQVEANFGGTKFSREIIH